MITDENQIKCYERQDHVDAYGMYTWQENFMTVSKLISEMRKRIEELEKKASS